MDDLATTAKVPSVVADRGSGKNKSAGPCARGAFIVLEGVDRSGKTTQVRLLEQRFKAEGRDVKRMGFPDRTTPIGQMIDGYLKSNVPMEDHVVHLLFSANRWEAADEIKCLLARGTTILCDRFYHSGIVYSAAKLNPSLSLSWARAPEKGLPRPDLVLFLDLDEEAARARGGWGGEVYERAEMQRRVRELFWGLSMRGRDVQGQEMLAELGGLEGAAWRQEEEDLVVVDAGGGVDEVAERVWEKARGKVEEVARGEMGTRVRVVE
ncbi:hypothetical protein E4U41_007014 [Claviceps citrina]|nr:hypothetical protein E4U41_007014 [Claviceps citrina]